VSSPRLGPVSLASVTDGTSNTALFSEHLLGYGTGLDDPSVSPAKAGSVLARRALFQINSIAPPPDQGVAGVAIATNLMAACQSLPGGTAPSADAAFGWSWLLSQGYVTANTSYTHFMTPNKYSCVGAESGFFGAQGNFTSDAANGGTTAAITATSNHPGGVNIGFADGSVKFIKDSINYQTWWALGSRNGGEVVSADAY
jgi:prepilin-type processing-associated H-X9-DG protein